MASEKRIKTKFFNALKAIAICEGIDLYYHSSLCLLNSVRTKKYDEDNVAIGVYIRKKVWHHELSFEMVNEIHLLKEDVTTSQPWTFAHELGHYFCLKNNNDESEDSADRYVSTLADMILDDFEKAFIGLELTVRSTPISELDSAFDVNMFILNKIKYQRIIFQKAVILYIKKRIQKAIKKIRKVFNLNLMK